MESDLTQTKVKLEEALGWVKSIQQAVMVDLPHVIDISFVRSSLTPGLSSVASACLLLVLQGLEDMSSREPRFLQMEHAWVTELEPELKSTRRESQDWAVEVTEAQAVELLMVETKATLQKSLAETEMVLQSTLETQETEWKALESEQKARSEADQEVLAL